MTSNYNTIRITDNDFETGIKSPTLKKYESELVTRPLNYPAAPYQDNNSDKDYTNYTGNSVLDDSFELDA